MKRAIIFLIAINASLILFLAGLLYLAETYPFHPGNPLFGVQSMAEQARINLTADPVHKAEMNFELVERRLADLVLIRQGGRVEPAVRAFDDCLTAAIHSIEALPAQEAEDILPGCGKSAGTGSVGFEQPGCEDYRPIFIKHGN